MTSRKKVRDDTGWLMHASVYNEAIDEITLLESEKRNLQSVLNDILTNYECGDNVDDKIKKTLELTNYK